jgi:hypothetical protein
MNRRGFFGLLAGATAAAIALPEIELLVPKRTIFLPPAGGWIGRGNQLLTIKYIAEEAIRALHANMEFMAMIDLEYDPSFRGSSQPSTIDVRRPPRFHRNAFQFLIPSIEIDV